MFGKRKFEQIAQSAIDEGFREAKKEHFWSNWYERNFDFKDDYRSYSWTRAVELRGMLDDVKQEVTRIAAALDKMGEHNMFCWDDGDKIQQLRQSLSYKERQERENRDLIEILPLLAQLYDMNSVVDEIHDYWLKYTDKIVFLAAYSLDGQSEDVKDSSLKLASMVYGNYADRIFECLIADKYPQYNNDKFHKLFDTITRSSGNIDEWFDIYRDYFVKEAVWALTEFNICDFLKITKPNIDRYFGTCHYFPDSCVGMHLPSEAKNSRFCLKLLEEYKAGRISGTPFNSDIERIMSSL